MPLLRPSIACAAAALIFAGCGGQTIHELPRAAEPPPSPPALARPAGDVTPVGTGAEGLVVDPASGVVAVGLRAPAALALVDGATGRVLRRVPLPAAPRHLSLAAAGGPVLVPAEAAGRLLTVGLPGGRIRSAVVVGRQPHDAAAARAGAIAGDERGNRLVLVRNGRVAGVAPTATQPGGVVALDRGRQVAVVAVRERVLELYDAISLRRLARVPAGVGPTHVACLDRGPCYVADTDGGAILVFSLRPRLELVRRVFLPGGPYGIALDRIRRRLYVTLPARNELVELPAHGRPHVLRRWPAVRQPDSVAVDERSGRVFVTGRAGGVLERLTP